MTSANVFALSTLVVAKLAGMAGLCCAYGGLRTAGAALLSAAGLLLFVVIVTCFAIMRMASPEDGKQASTREEAWDVAVLRRMLADGTLEEKLREAEQFRNPLERR